MAYVQSKTSNDVSNSIKLLLSALWWEIISKVLPRSEYAVVMATITHPQNMQIQIIAYLSIQMGGARWDIGISSQAP